MVGTAHARFCPPYEFEFVFLHRRLRRQRAPVPAQQLFDAARLAFDSRISTIG